MATRTAPTKPRAATAAPAAPPPPATDDSDAIAADAGELASILEQFRAADGYRVRVWRTREKQRPLYVGTVPLTADVLDDVQREFGGGAYMARTVDQNGVFLRDGTFTFEIDGAPRDPGAAPAAAAAPAPANAGPAPASRETLESMAIMQLFESMQNANRATVAVIERIAQPAPPTMTVEKIVAIGGLVSPIILELIKGRKRESLTADDVARIVGEKLTASGANASSVAQVVEQLRAMQELREMFGGDGEGGGDSLGAIAKMLAPLAERMLKQEPAPGDELAAPYALTAGAPAYLDGAPTQPMPSAHPAPPARPLWAQQLADYIPHIAQIAASGRDPRDFASSIIEYFMSDGDRGLLRELVANDDPVAIVTAQFPVLANYPKWLGEFLDEARAVLIGDDEEPDDDDDVAAPVLSKV